VLAETAEFKFTFMFMFKYTLARFGGENGYRSR
jgi:hypothetical protein